MFIVLMMIGAYGWNAIYIILVTIVYTGKKIKFPLMDF
jgi:hypothetical protein